MKNKVIWLCLSVLLVAAMLLASCAKSTTNSTSTSAPTSTKATTSTTTTSTTTKTTTSTTQPTTTTTVGTGNWWDSLGIPQYGGQITIRLNKDISTWDPFAMAFQMDISAAWFEKLFTDDWTLDPAVFGYQLIFRPIEYVKGQLAESWEFTDPSTFVVQLRKGVYWQNIPPLNGREFIADDVVYHCNRQFGLAGFPKPPTKTQPPVIQYLKSVTATDNYTVVFKWTISNPEIIEEPLRAVNVATMNMEAPEAVQLWGNLDDWHHAIGTGPFILKDFVSISSATLVKNPNYWGYDERYPQNQLPYIDTLKYLIIPDNGTAAAAMRTGKIDIMDNVSLQDAQAMQKTHPEILQVNIPFSNPFTIEPRNDTAPFNDIRVRKALQMAVNLPEIANKYYGGCSPDPSSLTSNYMTGWGFPYSQWPDDLKAEYAYNPTAAKQLLAEAGYSNGFKTNVVADITTDLNLLQIVQSYFGAINVDMEIRSMDTVSWTAFVRANHKQDALAMKSYGILGLGFEPTSDFVWYTPGTSADYAMVNDPVFNALSAKMATSTSLDEFKEIIKEANEEVTKQHFSICLVQTNVFTLVQPWLKGYKGQDDSIQGTATGPRLNGFYIGRFWIDQDVKTSMRH